MKSYPKANACDERVFFLWGLAQTVPSVLLFLTRRQLCADRILQPREEKICSQQLARANLGTARTIPFPYFSSEKLTAKYWKKFRFDSYKGFYLEEIKQEVILIIYKCALFLISCGTKRLAPTLNEPSIIGL
jgi:hypothetical protein